MFEYVGMFVSLCVLINQSGEVMSGFANVTGITSHTSKLIYHRKKQNRKTVGGCLYGQVSLVLFGYQFHLLYIIKYYWIFVSCPCCKNSIVIVSFLVLK